MNNSIRLTDEYFNVHILDKVIGQGGQGIVYRTKDPDLAVKIVTDEKGEPITDHSEARLLSNRLKMIRLLPIPDNLNLSFPLALLKDGVGYVMQLLSDMVPFSTFWLNGSDAKKIKSRDIPEWLSNSPEEIAKILVHYVNTGGLRRRLIALAKYASILARLHGNGFVYGDVSPNNAFISEEPSFSEVWLIDADNIEFINTSAKRIVFTPKYGAPEMVRGLSGASTLTDCYSFAVLAFYLLTMIHPFIGNLVTDCEEDDWAAESNDDPEEKAFAGLLPFVDDINDRSNSTSGGLPRQLVLTERLAALFQKTLGEGRTNFWKRPTIYHWPEALIAAADNTLICPSCKMSWFYNVPGESCPYCNTRKPLAILCEAYCWEGESMHLNNPCWSLVHELPASGISLMLPERLFYPFSTTSWEKAVLELRFEDRKLLITKAEEVGHEILIALPNDSDGLFREMGHQTQISAVAYEKGFWIYFGAYQPRIIKCSLLGDQS